jgi:hypothetical protein
VRGRLMTTLAVAGQSTVALIDRVFDGGAMAREVDGPSAEQDLDLYFCSGPRQHGKPSPLLPSMHPAWDSSGKYEASDPSVCMDLCKDLEVKAIRVVFASSGARGQPSAMASAFHLATCEAAAACAPDDDRPSAMPPAIDGTAGRLLASSSRLRPYAAPPSLGCRCRRFEAAIDREPPWSCR